MEELLNSKKKLDDDIETLKIKLARMMLASEMLAKQISSMQIKAMSNQSDMSAYAKKCRDYLMKNGKAIDLIYRVISDPHSEPWTLILVNQPGLNIESYSSKDWADDTAIIIVAHRWKLLEFLARYRNECYRSDKCVTLGPVHTTPIGTQYEQQMHIDRFTAIWCDPNVYKMVPPFTVDSYLEDEFRAIPIS